MRADRLVSLLLLLQVHQRMTVSELAKRLEVSRRTIYRDMEALSTAGIPITAERGAQGGWFLLEGYQTNLTGLSEAEVATLFWPRAVSLLADLGLQEAADSALIKVVEPQELSAQLAQIAATLLLFYQEGRQGDRS